MKAPPGDPDMSLLFQNEKSHVNQAIRVMLTRVLIILSNDKLVSKPVESSGSRRAATTLKQARLVMPYPVATPQR